MIRTRLAFGLILLLSFFYACTPSSTQKIYQATPPSARVFQDTLPFELREGFIVVRARLNNKSIPLDFIWDSGAPVSTIAQATRQYLGLPKNITPGTVVRLDSLRLGGATFSKVPVKVVDYEGYTAPKCIAEAGVIGANIVRHCNWYIDFDQQLIIFSDQTQQVRTDPAAHALSFKTTRYGQPELKVKATTMGKHKVLASVGHSGSLRAKVKKLPATGLMAYDRGILNRFATAVDTVAIFPDEPFSLGTLAWQSNLTVQRGEPSQLGNDLWTRYNVAIDYDSEVIRLFSRVQAPPSSAPLPQLGWMPYFTPTSDLTVGFIIVGSPAWDAGLRMGDVIDQIDRRAAPGWYNDYCAYLEKVQTQFAEPRQMLVFKNGAKQPLAITVEEGREQP